MKVRDLRQYIKTISKGNETLELVGSNKEYFLNMMSGQGQKVDALIAGAASFANNAKEQLFYEFVQNAYDASADSLFFYANEEFLIVLNNGEPFFTDLNIFDLPEGEEPRDGQLYNFLAKGKSLKLNDDDKLGKYGQGSKLLYTLLADINHNVNTEELLKDAIINNKKGPYLVSWHNMSQLDAWLINDDEWIPAQADDVENHILFAKILMSYYPIAPGQDLERFSNEEAQRAIKAFNELVDPPRNKSFLTRGTALIIPLGKGKYDAIIEENNLENVRARLGVFASITADQERNVGKSLKHIYVMGKEAEQHPVSSLFVDFVEEGNKFHYHFAFNPIFAEKNVVNFFKGLPILQTKYRFGFILDSQILEVDDSRQRISDTEKTCDQLRLAYTHLVDELKSLLVTNREKFDYIYQSLISSRPEDNSEDEQKIRKAFYDVIRPFLKEYAYTSEGTYVPFEQVCEEEKETNVLLKDIGITDLHWIDNESRKKYSFHFDKKVRVLRFAEMLQMADMEKLSAWIKCMSKEDYRLFHTNCLDCISDIETIQLFRSNENNLYSWGELKSDINVYYMAQTTQPIFVDQEYIVEPMCKEYDKDDYSNLFGKIKANLAELRETSMGRDAVCQTLCMIAENESDYEDEIINGITVLQNWRGDYLPFSELFEERLDGTILFDNFRIKGSIPECIKQRDWLIDKQGDNTALWNWIVNHFDDIKQGDGWGDNTDAYLRDIQNAYKAGGTSVAGSLLRLYLDKDGKPTDEPCQNVENFDKLSEAEYEKLQASYSDYNFVPYKYEKVLSSAPFMMNTLYVYDLIDPNQFIDFDTLAILSKISSDGFLLKYRVIGNDNSFIVQALNGGKNYTNDLDTDLRSALLEIGFYYIPQKVQTLIPSDTNAFNITRDDFANSVVDKISDKNLIFPLIRDCSSAVVEHYINSLSIISINHKITDSDIRWQIIKFAVSRDTKENEFRKTIFNCIRHNNEGLPETIKDSVFIAYDHEYSLYALNGDYQEENEHIDSFLDCLPSDNDAEWFKEQFYGDKKENVSCKEIYDEIKNKHLTIEQLRFCLDYSLNDEPDYYNLEIGKEESLSEALTMIKTNQYRGFDEYFKISDFDSETQVFAEQSLLNDEEKLPNEMQKWLEQNVDAINLFENIRTDSESYISVRRLIRDNEEAIAIPDFEDPDKTESIINWLLNAELIYVYGDNAYKNIKRIIDRLPEGIVNMVFLRYTGNVECRNKSLDSICPTFTLEEYDKESCFLSIYSWTPIFLDMLMNDKKVQNFFVNEVVFAYEGLELLSKHKLHKSPKLEVSVKAHEGDYNEIATEPYQIWKNMPESIGILIKTSKKPIGINFTMLKNREQVFSKAIDNKEFGYDTNGLVVVQYPNTEKISAIKMIEKHIADMEFFQQPFIVLQGLYVDQLEKLEQIAEEKGTDIATIVQTSEKSISNTGDNDANLKVDEDKLDNIKELAESFDADELMELADKKDMILEILHEMQEVDDETQESQVRQTIGYIGELIYEQYLLAQGKDYKYAAIEGIGDYDFHNITDRIYVDVKTTLYSLKDGTAPFYLHKSQNTFMQKHPNEKYHIVRISLNDLDLQKSYERIRDIYGKEANPMIDERLKEDCLKIAKKYWRGAKIEQFDALSPEYSIKIEKK